MMNTLQTSARYILARKRNLQVKAAGNVLLAVLFFSVVVYAIDGKKASDRVVIQKDKIEQFSKSSAWLRLYQYEKSGSKYKSEVDSPVFFFSEMGKENPATELEAAIEAYNGLEKKFGSSKGYAACVFPARLEVIEQGLSVRFDHPECRDLNEWLTNLDATDASILFAGTYSQNPASLFGHTALRLYSKKTDSTGKPLLSYVVGFMAQTNPSDNKVMFILKGLTGGYPGFYQMEPFYMTVGLYNNSESRDIWERKIKLSFSQMNLLKLHLWELSMNAASDYYFARKNCSYRILSLLEAAVPENHLTNEVSITGLPYDTIRILDEQGLLLPGTDFYSSIKRKHALRRARLNSVQLEKYESARENIEDVKSLDDIDILDTLIDEWTYRNYRAKTLLPDDEKQVMEATLLRRSQIPQKPSPILSDSEIAKRDELLPPNEGHRSKWTTIRAGANQAGQSMFGMDVWVGAHGYWQNSQGYDRHMAIAYLGLNFEYNSKLKELNNLVATVVDARSLDDFNSIGSPISWSSSVYLQKNCYFCDTKEGAFHATGAAGISQHFSKSRLIVSILPEIEVSVWKSKNITAGFWPGFGAVLKYDFYIARLIGEAHAKWISDRWGFELTSKLAFNISKEASIILDQSSQFLNERDQAQAYRVGYERHF